MSLWKNYQAISNRLIQKGVREMLVKLYGLLLRAIERNDIRLKAKILDRIDRQYMKG
jgi:hypothetical protein